MTNQNVERMNAFNARIALRLSDAEKEKAELLIRERKFKNLSQLVRTALTELLKKHEENQTNDQQTN